MDRSESIRSHDGVQKDFRVKCCPYLYCGRVMTGDGCFVVMNVKSLIERATLTGWLNVNEG